jgi:hypothetical protein
MWMPNARESGEPTIMAGECVEPTARCDSLQLLWRIPRMHPAILVKIAGL